MCIHVVAQLEPPQPEPPTGTRCTPIPGQPGCVCDGPKGKIDLTELANTDNTPR